MDWLLFSILNIALAIFTLLGYKIIISSAFCMLLLSSNEESHLKISPRDLQSKHIAFAFLLLVLKSVSQALFNYPRLHLGKSSHGEINDEYTVEVLPFLGLRLELSMLLKLDKAVQTNYEQAVRHQLCPSNHGDLGQLAMMLSAISEPAMLLLLAKQVCPVRPLGAVNVRNKFEILLPAACRQALSYFNEASLSTRATLEPYARKVKRGFEFDLICEVVSPDLGGTIFRQTFTMLQFAKHSKEIRRGGSAEARKSVLFSPNRDHAKSFEIGFDEPTLWASVCKDYNPIHVSKLAARCLGFPSKIAHGNHVVAKAFAAIQKNDDSTSIPTTLCSNKESIPSDPETATWINVEFKRPIIVPSTLEIWPLETLKSDVSPNKSFDIVHKRKLCVEVRSGPIEYI